MLIQMITNINLIYMVRFYYIRKIFNMNKKFRKKLREQKQYKPIYFDCLQNAK